MLAPVMWWQDEREWGDAVLVPKGEGAPTALPSSSLDDLSLTPSLRQEGQEGRWRGRNPRWDCQVSRCLQIWLLPFPAFFQHKPHSTALGLGAWDLPLSLSLSHSLTHSLTHLLPHLHPSLLHLLLLLILLHLLTYIYIYFSFYLSIYFYPGWCQYCGVWVRKLECGLVLVGLCVCGLVCE